MSEQPNKLQSEVLTFLENEKIVRLKDYMERGRAHKGGELGALKEEWVGAFRLFSHSPADEVNRRHMHDLEAELTLRSEEPPYDAVQEEVERFIQMTDRVYRDMSPQRIAEANEALQADIDRFLDEPPEQKN